MLLIILTLGLLISFIAKCFFGRFIGNKGSIVITTTLMGFNVIFCFILFYIYFFEKTYLINLIQIISTCIFDDWKSKEYYISILIMFVIFCTILIFLILFFLINLILDFLFLIIILLFILYIYCQLTGVCVLQQFFITDVYSMVILFTLPAKREIFFFKRNFL